MPNWCEGTIVSKQIWTEGLFTIRVRVPDVQPFLAGQFLQLGLPAPEQLEATGEPKLINRPYSVASPHGP